MDARLAGCIDHEVEEAGKAGKVAFVVLWPGGKGEAPGYATGSVSLEVLGRNDRVSSAAMVGSLLLRCIDELMHARSHLQGMGVDEDGQPDPR